MGPPFICQQKSLRWRKTHHQILLIWPTSSTLRELSACWTWIRKIWISCCTLEPRVFFPQVLYFHCIACHTCKIHIKHVKAEEVRIRRNPVTLCIMLSLLMYAGMCIHCVCVSAKFCQKIQQCADPYWKRRNISLFPFRLIQTIQSLAKARQEQNGNGGTLRGCAWLFICVSTGETGAPSPLWGYES